MITNHAPSPDNADRPDGVGGETPPNPRAPRPAGAPPPAPAPADERINILLVDDEPKNLTALKSVLDDPGYRLVTAESADQALLALVVEEFALLVLDIQMPVMNGFELAQMIKQRKKTASVPIIFLTAYYSEDQHILEGYGTGAVDYLHKPVNTAILRSKVAVFAELHRKTRELAHANRSLLAEVGERRRVQEQLQRLNNELEHRVQERTASLLRSEAFSRGVVESSADCFKVFSLDGRLQWINENGKRLLEVQDFDALRGCDWSSFWRRGDVEGQAESALAAARSGGAGRFRGYCPTLAGTPRWWDVVVTPIPGPDGAPEQLLCVSRDVTEQRDAEEALRASEQQFRFLADSIPQLVWTATPEGRLAFANRRWYEFTGVAPGHEAYAWREICHPDDLQATADAWERAVRTGDAYTREHRIRRLDGEYRWLLSRAYAQKDADGAVVQWFGTATDITDLKQAQGALEEADRRKDEFLAMLAHELRNPLAPIRNALEILRLTGSQRAELVAARDLIERQVQHMVRLVDDLLDVSRVSRGKITLQKEPVDLAAAVRQAVEMSQPLIDSRRHELTVALPGEPVPVEGDFTRLAQVALNLLNNAAKYTDPGGRIWLSVEKALSGPPRPRFGGEGSGVRGPEAQPQAEPLTPDSSPPSTGARGEWAVLRIRDTGRGVDPAALRSLFDLFYQVDRTIDRSDGGLGIGLSLVKNLVQLHGGTVEAHSAGRGRGSEFIVRLPCLPPEAADQAGAPAAAPARPPRGARVLVVDDNRDSADSMALMLRLEGHQVETAYDGKRAVEAALEGRPEVVLLDIGLPGLDGYQACEAMRSGGLADTLIVAMTGYGQEEDRRRSYEAGFDSHHVKPVDVRLIRELVARQAEVRQRGG
jgi:two-component system CheB/CheR fusion protein